MQQYIDRARKVLRCQHPEAITIDTGNKAIQWCPECGAIKQADVWTSNKTVEFVRSIGHLFGL